MAETPDFDQIARRLSSLAGAFVTSPRSIPEAEIAEQLRLMWNARGAADVDAVERELDGMEGVKAASAAIRDLDITLISAAP